MELDLPHDQLLELGWTLAVADVPTRADREHLDQLVVQLREPTSASSQPGPWPRPLTGTRSSNRDRPRQTRVLAQAQHDL